jgi:cold-inducible RNA-binding protein
MSTKIYVGNLPYSVSENDLSELFKPFGEVIGVKLIVDKISGRSKGFGFVEMEKQEADNAIAALNGKDFGGRTLKIDQARPQEAPRKSSGSRH